jgi:hypothetical protein
MTSVVKLPRIYRDDSKHRPVQAMAIILLLTSEGLYIVSLIIAMH